MTTTTQRWPAHWDAQRIAEFKAAMTKVHHRNPGTLCLGAVDNEPLQGPCRAAPQPTVRPFDAKKYWDSVDRFCNEIRSYIAHMARVRAGLVTDIPQLAA